ncbi:unnamed protein product [Orchesella dallaii]|uniref:Odorant receptor n=1 Tax=Orchesella dallaii TaxID=48710 RepID=A0ABP1PIB1_9HEXA
MGFVKAPLEVFLLQFFLPQKLLMVSIRVDATAKTTRLPSRFMNSMWYWSGFVPMAASAFQFYWNCFSNPSSDLHELAIIAYHGIVLALNVGAQTVYYKIRYQPENFLRLFNCMRRFGFPRKLPYNREEYGMVVVAMVSLVGCLVTTICIPLVPAIFPKVQDPLLKFVFKISPTCFNQTNGVVIRSLLYFLEFSLRSACFVLGTTIGILSLIVLNCLNREIEYFRLFMPKEKDVLCNPAIRMEHFLFYRQLQLVFHLCNECFQNFAWPIIHFFGAIITIAASFLLMVHKKSLGKETYLFLLSLIGWVLLFIGYMIEYGSMPKLISKKMLNNYRRCWGKEKFSRKYLRACQPLAIRMGPFHEMNRSRMPAFLRFCLQRTIFLVVQTETKIF